MAGLEHVVPHQRKRAKTSGTRLKRIAWLGIPGVAILAFYRGLPAREATPSVSVLRIANNHEMAYSGPLTFATKAPDGVYAGSRGHGVVRAGMATLVVSVPANATVTLEPSNAPASANGPLTVKPDAGSLTLDWSGRTLGQLGIDLVVLPGTRASTDDAARSFTNAQIAWDRSADGTLHSTISREGYTAALQATPYAGGWIDLRARIAPTGATPTRAYVGLIRRVVTPGFSQPKQRFNGVITDSASSTEGWNRDFWYPHGLDWLSWRAAGLSFAAINGFTPGPSFKVDSTWQEGSHFYVWEKSRGVGDTLFLISEVEGPNPHQATPRQKAVTAYAPIQLGDTVDLHWRLAITPEPTKQWEDGQLYVFAGYRATEATADGEQLNLGVPFVNFGTSYFPYSTISENFDFYRVKGELSETWWTFSPTMWKQWRAFEPRILTDLHIVRAMGFSYVRLHHLEMLQQMDRTEALAFLDWYVAQAKQLGLRVLLDSEGPNEWLALLAKRYGDVVDRFELENEVLIPGIPPAAPARWKAGYEAIKRERPNAQVFLTGAGNNGIFERLRVMGVPFDRVGLHTYKHGPGYEEGLGSIALASADYARRLGKEVTVGEFNWKNFTRYSPEDRRDVVAKVYASMLAPRAVPEVFEFHFQETMSVNPRISRPGVRHYEPLKLDRRLKPEGKELEKLIRQYSDPASAVGQLNIDIPEVSFRNGEASAAYTLTNRTGRPLTVTLNAVAFDGTEATLATSARLAIPANGAVKGSTRLRLPSDAAHGAYHWFLKADFNGLTRWGWGVVANSGAPTFDAKATMPDRVNYAQPVSALEQLPWTGPITVAWGPDAPVLELESAYLVANSIAAATGTSVSYMGTADLPARASHEGILILVGTPASNTLVGAATPRITDTRGVVSVVNAGSNTSAKILLTGRDSLAVEAAAMDFALRYWKHAKDAAIRVIGMEPGAALGHPAGVGDVNPP